MDQNWKIVETKKEHFISTGIKIIFKPLIIELNNINSNIQYLSTFLSDDKRKKGGNWIFKVIKSM